jgi:hypothetical protein
VKTAPGLDFSGFFAINSSCLNLFLLAKTFPAVATRRRNNHA